jgi:SAM-dependent methyltransferase
MNDLILDTQAVSAETLSERPHSAPERLEDILSCLKSPDGDGVLKCDAGSNTLRCGDGVYPIREGLPVLLPQRLLPYFSDRLSVPFEASQDAFMQYFLLASIKQSGEINPINSTEVDLHFQRHLYRLQDFVKAQTGRVLDIGCDDPKIGASLFPSACSYLGLDPFCVRTDPFRVIGVGEYLPFVDNTFDAVLFNTSLDHIMDWRQAIQEATRVLKPGGRLIIATLVWTARESMITDSVHFHHFRDYELLGALHEYQVERVKRYDYKNASHRHGMYISAVRTVGEIESHVV